jgi:hypothetical protein
MPEAANFVGHTWFKSHAQAAVLNCTNCTNGTNGTTNGTNGTTNGTNGTTNGTNGRKMAVADLKSYLGHMDIE